LIFNLHRTDTLRTNLIRRRSLLKLSAGLTVSGLFPGLATGNSERQHLSAGLKLLFDTDIGSDIDDAVALAYLLMQPSIDLLGITTVTGEARKRAALASRLLELAGQTVPIFPGFEAPIEIATRQPVAQQAVKLSPAQLLGTDQPHNPEAAIDFMADTIQAHPFEITLLAVGPFTNVARLFEKYPDVSRLLKSLVIMGGKYSDYPTPWGPSEWNGIIDPAATALMFAKAECPIRAFGLDITWQVSMDAQQVSRAFATHPLLREVRRWSEVWFAERDALHFHDPLAAVSLFDPTVCTYKYGEVAVDLSPGREGFTEFVAANPQGTATSDRPLVEVAASVNKDQFFDQYFAPFAPRAISALT
jgi:purine nucleosidase